MIVYSAIIRLKLIITGFHFDAMNIHGSELRLFTGLAGKAAEERFSLTGDGAV